MTDRDLLRALRRHGYHARRRGNRFHVRNCWPASVCRLALERLLENLERAKR